jgi:hypothetical protein
MNKIRVAVSAADYERIRDMHYSVVKMSLSIRVGSGDLLFVESEHMSTALGYNCPLVREVVDIDCSTYIFEGSSTYDVFIRNNNYLS